MGAKLSPANARITRRGEKFGLTMPPEKTQRELHNIAPSRGEQCLTGKLLAKVLARDFKLAQHPRKVAVDSFFSTAWMA